MGTDIDDPPEPAGTLPLSGVESLPPLASLLAEAARRRPDLAALAFEQRAAADSASLARREAVPDVGIRGFVTREDGTDTIIGLGISLPIPVWDRNQGQVHIARSRQRSAAARAQLEQRAVQAEIATAYQVLAATRASYDAMKQGVLGKLGENLELLRKAFEAGKVGWTDVLVLRRSFIEAERELAQAAAEVERARVRLQLAAGTLPMPTDVQER